MDDSRLLGQLSKTECTFRTVNDHSYGPEKRVPLVALPPALSLSSRGRMHTPSFSPRGSPFLQGAGASHSRQAAGPRAHRHGGQLRGPAHEETADDAACQASCAPAQLAVSGSWAQGAGVDYGSFSRWVNEYHSTPSSAMHFAAVWFCCASLATALLAVFGTHIRPPPISPRERERRVTLGGVTFYIPKP